MAKRRLKLRVRLPPYRPPRNAWRAAIHAAVKREADARAVTYRADDRLQLKVILYLSESELRFHDVDNRLKDIMDALQGRAGGPKTNRRLMPILPNDHQVFRVTIEKRLPPGQSHGMGHVELLKYE